MFKTHLLLSIWSFKWHPFHMLWTHIAPCLLAHWHPTHCLNIDCHLDNEVWIMSTQVHECTQTWWWKGHHTITQNDTVERNCGMALRFVKECFFSHKKYLLNFTRFCQGWHWGPVTSFQLKKDFLPVAFNYNSSTRKTYSLFSLCHHSSVRFFLCDCHYQEWSNTEDTLIYKKM